MPKQQNTFENGLNQDVSVIKQPQGTYRDLQNGMLISYDGNHYSVETALGNKVNFSIPPRYNGVYTALDTPPLPIGLISFIDKLIVHSTNSTNGGYGEIGTVVFDNAGTGTYTPLYHDINLNYAKIHKIFGFTYAENDNIKRNYWTDYNNELRVINTSDPFLIPSAYIQAAGPLVNLTRYMVVNGAVEYPSGSTQYYGPGLTLGNIFTATTGGGTSYTIKDNGNNPTGSPIVVQYIDYHLLSFNPDRKMGSIDFNKWLSGGTVTGGSKMFFYRLGLANQGYVTSWSYGSFPINVSGPSLTNWKDQVGAGANGTATNSTKGIEIQISNIDTAFDTIEVAVAEFDVKNNILTDAKIISSSIITSDTMLFQFYGGENIKALSINDLTIFPASIKTAKDLCTAKNYITIVNLKERDEITFDETIITIADAVYKIPADDNGNDTNMQQGTRFNGAAGQTPTIGNDILPDGKYRVTGGSAIYNGITYVAGAPHDGDIFVGIAGVPNWTNGGGAPIVHAVLVIEKYIDNGGFAVNKVITIQDDYWDYKGMATTQYLRQYWSGETYRMGILFYDLKGNPYFVRWAGDKKIQGISAKGGLIIDQTNNSIQNWSLQANGLKFSNIQISPTLATKISGFSIVRAPRDRQYFAQGLVFSIVRDKNPANNTTHPMAEAMLANDDNYTNQGGPYNAYSWHSPDAFCLSSLFSPTATGNKLEGENFVDPIDLNNGGAINGPVPNCSFTKYYNVPGLTQSAPFSETILAYAMVNPDSSVGGFISTTFENTFLRTNGGGNPANAEAKGGNCVIMQLQNGISYNGSNITAPANSGSAVKAIANYKVPKGILYGGQGKDAIANTPFISTGHFQEINSTVLAGLPTSGGNYVFNNVEVYGGDSFVSIFDHAKALFDDTLGAPYSYGVFFPVESNVNHSLRQELGTDKLLAKSGMQGTNNGIVWKESGATRLEAFYANDAYTSDGGIFQYPALPVNFNVTDTFLFRFRWAGAKIAGERYDTFRVFLINNFRDVDGQRGQINNVASKNGKVYYWQDKGIGTVPILERQVVSGVLGEATQLGVGGVIDRFDEYDTYFGNQHQSSLVSTEFGFSWFDMRRRAWLVMGLMGQKEEISVAKGLQAFFNSIFEANPLANAIISTDTPLVGIGIHGVYDARFKTTLLTFKSYQTHFEATPYVNYDFTVGYNHTKNVIVGFFPGMTPAIWHQHNRQLISAKNSNGNGIAPLTTYSVGDEIQDVGITYVCIEAFTTHSPVQPFEKPTLGGSLLWAKMYSEKEIYNSWEGDVCKHYGRVYPHVLKIIINPETQEAFTVDNLQIKSTANQNFDAVLCETDNDSAQDTNLNLGNRNYRVRDNAWESSVPIGSKGRLTDYYLSVKFTLNNYLTNPTISKNLKKVTAFVNSVFRVRY